MVPVSEIWSYWLQHKQELEHKHICVADFPDDEIEIYLTNDYGYPSFSVDVNGFTETEEITIDKKDTESTYEALLNSVVEDEVLTKNDDDENEDADEKIEVEDTSIELEENEYLTRDDLNRIDEISDAVHCLLAVLLEADPDDAGFDQSEIQLVAEEIEDVLDDIYLPSELEEALEEAEEE